ncbi:MAG: 50S ribosomal protein L2 [archaeon]
MGKRIIQQARGKGSSRYRVRNLAFNYEFKYPRLKETGDAQIIKLFDAVGYSAPLAKIKFKDRIYFNLAAKNIFEGQMIKIGTEEVAPGNITEIKKVPLGTEIFNIEAFPGGNGKFVRAGGGAARITKKDSKTITIQFPSKKTKEIHPEARVTIGKVAAGGRVDKPMLKAGKKSHMVRAKGGKVYPRTSAVKFNAVDHPFGSGRGKRIKSKIAQRNAPPGQKVGLLRPRRTGKRK